MLATPHSVRQLLRTYPRLNPRRALMRRSGWVDCTRQNLRWKLRVDQYIDSELYHKGAFEPKTTNWLREVVKPGMRVIDVGANFGYFTALLADFVGPDGHVWAFEPTQFYGRRIEPHLASNGLSDRVTIVPCALSDRNATLDITISRSSATLHPVLDDVPEASEAIQLRPLDDLADEMNIDRVDMIKIDVDGHEPAVLQGARQVIAKHQPIIVIEMSQANLDVAGSDARELARQLQSMGYDLHSERTRKPYPSRDAFLRECGNFTHSANVWCFPRTESSEHGAAI